MKLHELHKPYTPPLQDFLTTSFKSTQTRYHRLQPTHPPIA